MFGPTGAQAHGVRVAARDPCRCASLRVATTEAGVLTSGTCRRGRPWRARALLQVATVSDHRGRYITQLLDRARSCQPLLTIHGRRSATLWVGGSPCLGRELPETVGVSPVQVPFQEECGDEDGAAHGTSRWPAPAHTRTERANRMKASLSSVCRTCSRMRSGVTSPAGRRAVDEMAHRVASPPCPTARPRGI
jgi:hypothetical protein